MRCDIESSSEGRALRGWLYRPEGDATRHPCMVMAHGLSAAKDQYLDWYAKAFVADGLVALTFDHANFGANDGLPRQEADPAPTRLIVLQGDEAAVRAFRADPAK